MRVLVDTSAWVDFFNRHPSREAEVLTRLIEDEVDLVTCGIRRKESLPELEGQFRDMECLAPREPDTYFAAAQLYRELRAKGLTVRSTIDCLIVRLAEENGALVLAKDRDMMQILGSGLTTARGLAAPHPD
jgi:predicted nucleic acid-binding protein